MTLDRIYTLLDVSSDGPISEARKAKGFHEPGITVDVNTITPEETLEHTNRIFSPYTVAFKSPLSWFALWRGQYDILYDEEALLTYCDCFSERTCCAVVLFRESQGSPRWGCCVSVKSPDSNSRFNEKTQSCA
jgi:hypothetical protein